ncbi:hypothetical protein GCM10009801_66560 [Streptomyces albiaxialis]|uniref:Tat pathway signal protein n=1 Tax=Streptomyces albiaxialis TaxID=329523 RepID=A0ABN2WR83_9ACTN
MSLDRRQLLRGSLAVGAAAVPFASATPAYARQDRGAAQTPPASFYLALLDAHNNVVETYYTGDIDAQTNRFGLPKSSFPTGGWAPLECKFRKLNSGESVFMVCGGDPDKGRVTIHRNSDSAALGWDPDLPIYPHSLEYLPTADVVIVVGTRGLEQHDPPKGPHQKRGGGCYQLYLAPSAGSPGVLRKVPGLTDKERAFRQAHGVVRDQNHPNRVWIFGGSKLVCYEVTGKRETTRLREMYRAEDSLDPAKKPVFENGHDLQPDPVDTQFLWATGSAFQLKINKAGGPPRVEWSYPLPRVKSFSRHRSGRGIYTIDSENNPFGTDKVDFLWPSQTVTVPQGPGQKEKWIYKARLTDI